jgi:RNA methyltransferase, TrmH family
VTGSGSWGERPDSSVLTNIRSDRVKAVRRLSGRSARGRAGAFVVEGPQGVREAVRAHAESLTAAGEPVVRDLYMTAEAERRHSGIVEAALSAGLIIRAVTEDVLAAMATTVTPQGMIAVCRLTGDTLDGIAGTSPRLVAVLSQVRDPGNAGTVIRTADAAGAEAVVFTDASVDVHNPKCVRSTAGSMFHLPVAEEVTLARTVFRLRSTGLTILAADGAGDVDLDQLADAADAGRPGGIAGPVAWIFGNEAWGLSEDERSLADHVVRIPIHGRAESLNLASAVAVCLYATARSQRRGAGCRVEGTTPQR